MGSHIGSRCPKNVGTQVTQASLYFCFYLAQQYLKLQCMPSREKLPQAGRSVH